ncbi:acyltransferase domain-containing protein [Streptacidiphilus sp. 4-A2]|nr:acyltransferase domain-containing protein [Streptacidiphilus sp. 4-A2]
MLTLPDAAALVAARGRLLQALPEGGAMAALTLPEQQVLPLLEGLTGEVSVAAVNGPAATVVSGDEQAVLEVVARAGALGGRARRLRVSHAFHSPRMESALAGFRRIAEGVEYRQPAITLLSDLTGEPVAPTPTTGSATCAAPCGSWTACAGWSARA